MSVLEAFFAPNLQNPKTALASPLVSATFYSSYIRLKDPVLPTMQKKVHFVWCKVYLTLLSSEEFCESRVEKTSSLRVKSTLFGPFLAFFSHFPALGRFAVLSP
jgi:hypothetical protein